ncbi:MAG: glycosyltransferase [bacterium]
MQNLITQQIYKNKFDCIFVHLIRMAEYVRHIPLPKILDMGDAQSLNYIRGHSHRRGLWSIINRVESWRTENYERHIWKNFDKTLVVSPIDAEYLRQLNKQMNVEVMPIGFDIRSLPFRLNKHLNKNICFLGNMRTFPNTDAVIWFCDKIFPLIKEHLPEVEFHIVGAEPSRHVMKLAARKDVYVTGKVDIVNQYVYDASVMVVPMRIGAGIQTKIYESMALGTPVVTTPIGMEGIACTQGKDILIADAPDDFANKVVELIKNKNLRAQISKCARQTAEKNYRYDKLLRKMDNILMSCSS